jgi:Protein of unknown function (DUF1194)
MYRKPILCGVLVSIAFGLLVDRADATPRIQSRSDLALVLAVDASGSINEREFAVQLNGIANAFRQREVIDAIQSGPIGTIEVALLLWGGEINQAVSSGWFRVSKDGEAETFAAHVARFPRHAYGTTAIGNGIMAALTLLREVVGRAERLCIDISGDGKETILMRSRHRAFAPNSARANAEILHVTINALAIENEESDLAGC